MGSRTRGRPPTRWIEMMLKISKYIKNWQRVAAYLWNWRKRAVEAAKICNSHFSGGKTTTLTGDSICPAPGNHTPALENQFSPKPVHNRSILDKRNEPAKFQVS
ncbi:hypothetical protein TNCV_3734041 [Trichonephila clavipes]|nr:hypothetical protein TNCV_3734041 [Trichonephila clavipes]